jgi:hypothetical protein
MEMLFVRGDGVILVRISSPSRCPSQPPLLFRYHRLHAHDLHPEGHSFDVVRFHALFNVTSLSWLGHLCVSSFHRLIIGRGTLNQELGDRIALSSRDCQGYRLQYTQCVPGIGKYNTKLSIIIPIHEHSRPFI